MGIFRTSKNSKESSIKADMSMWSEKELHWLAERFSSKHASLEFDVTGLRHSIGFRGEDYKYAIKSARSEQEAYEEMPLIFESPPQTENHITYNVHALKIMGLLRYPKAKVECEIVVGNHENIEDGNLGFLSIQRIEPFEQLAAHYLVSAQFAVQTEFQRAEILHMLKAVVIAKGIASLNFHLEPIECADTWVSKLKIEHYTPSSIIRSVFVASNIGREATLDLF